MNNGNIDNHLADQSTDFDCAICTGSFNYRSITVVQLPCEHQLCYKCYHALETTLCPFCRQPFEFEIHPPKSVIDSWQRNLQKWIKEAVEEYMETTELLRSYQMQPEYFDLPTFLEVALTPAIPRGRRRRRRRAGSGSVQPVSMQVDI